jgi:hypothetical protein
MKVGGFETYTENGQLIINDPENKIKAKQARLIARYLMEEGFIPKGGVSIKVIRNVIFRRRERI